MDAINPRCAEDMDENPAKRQKVDEHRIEQAVNVAPTPAKNGSVHSLAVEKPEDKVECKLVQSNWWKKERDLNGPASSSTEPAFNSLHDAMRERANMNTFAAQLYYFHSTALKYHQWPEFLLPQNLKDKYGRRPEHPDYDQTTLLTPSDEELAAKCPITKKDLFTPMLRQYWKIKRDAFDKIALFKVGKFYEIFYYDAYIAQHVCDLKWMSGDKRPHVGFPEVALHANAAKLVKEGIVSVVVEQVETAQEARNRAKKSTATVDRKACEVFTPGTLVHSDMLGHNKNANFTLILRQEQEINSTEVVDPMKAAHMLFTFGIVLVDVLTGQYLIGYLQDTQDRGQLRTMLAQVQPTEIVYNPRNVSASVVKMLKQLPVRPALIPYDDGLKSVSMASQIVDTEKRKLKGGAMPVEVEDTLQTEAACFALAMSFRYLDSVMLKDSVLPVAIWDIYNPIKSRKHMVLDATALDNLEILRIPNSRQSHYSSHSGVFTGMAERGSLLYHLNHTSTAFGYRLLKKWVCAPLIDVIEIKKRQDVVEYLLEHPSWTKIVKDSLKELGDMERQFTRMCSLGVQLQTRKAVLYADIISKRLMEFYKLLEAFDKCAHLAEKLSKHHTEKSPLPEKLKSLVVSIEQGGGFPDVRQINKDFRENYVDVADTGAKVPTYTPKTGKDPAFDAIMVKSRAKKAELDNELNLLKYRFPTAGLVYVHRQPAYRYEIEVADTKIPKSFIDDPKQCNTTSSKKGYIRFQTPAIVKLIQELDEIDQEQKDAMYPFTANLFQDFYKHHHRYIVVVNCMAELDALLSLAIASAYSPYGEMIRPEFVPIKDHDNDLPVLELENCRHPVSELQGAFTPNDTIIPGKPSILLITGPNMGGKSTILRQTSIAVIMAQLGMRVCCTKARLTPVDRIFTRVGAQDSMIEGKSTFLMELEETSQILQHASRFSLAIIDELGRGTSTFDGAAIALSVLEYLSKSVRCRTLFATHYHLLGITHHSEEITPFYMEVDFTEKGELVFLYKLVPGICPDSHGRHVAKLASLPAEVIQVAEAKSEQWRVDHQDQGPELLTNEILNALAKNDWAAIRNIFKHRKDWGRCL